jgi:hypothetical protein
MSRYLALGGVLAVAFLCLTLAHHPTPASVAQESELLSGEALRVAIDPETGELKHLPPDPDVRGLNMNRSVEGLTEVVHADGSASVDLQGRFQCYITASIDADGKVTYGCDHDSHTTNQAAAAAPTH